MVRKTSNQKNLKRPDLPARATLSTSKTPPISKKAKEAKPVKMAVPAKGVKPKDAKKETKPTAKPVAGVKEPPKKKRSKSAVVRLKAFWGVFNQMMKRVHLFEYSERRQADKKAAELTGSSKSPHFVQLVKEVIRDAD